MLGAKKHFVKLEMSVEPNPEGGQPKHVIIEPNENADSDLANTIRRYQLKAINASLVSSLARGPLLGCQVRDVLVKLHSISLGRGTSVTMITACASRCIQEAMKNAAPILLEPTMNLEIETDDSRLGTVLSDLSNRRCDILDIDAQSDKRSVHALAPLAELVNFATVLRTITSGTASFSMELAHYKVMNQNEQRKVIQKLTGITT